MSNSFSLFVLRLHFNLTNLSIKIILNITKADRVISKYQKRVFLLECIFDKSVDSEVKEFKTFLFTEKILHSESQHKILTDA